MPERNINWSGIKKTAIAPVKFVFSKSGFVTGILGSAVYGLYLGLSGISNWVDETNSKFLVQQKSEEFNKQFNENLKKEGYSIGDVTTVVFSQEITGQPSVISYNYRDNIITIDGRDEADRVLTFKEYDNKGINYAKEVGCDISSSVPVLLREFLTTHERAHPNAEYLTEKHTEFYDANCKGPK